MGLRLPPSRKVPLAHSGAFAKYVGDFDAVFSQASPCSDGVDNDEDCRTDLEDPKCLDARTDERPLPEGRVPMTGRSGLLPVQVVPVDARFPATG
jgi:hypothetical protein